MQADPAQPAGRQPALQHLMVCEARRRRGGVPTAADLAFHRRLVAQIKASFTERRMTLEERLKALIELQHHQQHEAEVTTAVYSGQPLPAEELEAVLLGMPQAAIRALPHPIYELPELSSHEPVVTILLDPITKQPVKRKDGG